jgi:hypothetical protein
LNQGYPVSIVAVDGVRYPVAIVAVVGSGYPVAIVAVDGVRYPVAIVAVDGIRYPVAIVAVDGVRYPVAIVAVVGSGYPVAIGPGITAPKVMPTEVITKTTRIARPACQGENRVVIIFLYCLPYLRILRKPRISCNLKVLLCTDRYPSDTNISWIFSKKG